MNIGSATVVVNCKNCGGTGNPGTIAGSRIICGTCGGTGTVLTSYAAILPLPPDTPEAE